jgi:hypothetical protein
MISAYEHGRNAAKHGKHIQACPFDTGTTEWREWRAGFHGLSQTSPKSSYKLTIASTLPSCFVFIVANLLLGLGPVVAQAQEQSPAQQAQKTAQKVSNEHSAPVLIGVQVAQAWWTVAGQNEAQYSDSTSLGIKPRRAHDRQRRSEARCTTVTEGCLEREAGTVTAESNADEIRTDVVFGVPLSSEQRAEIWRGLGEQATETSIPAGLRVGERVPSTMRLLSFSDVLRQKVPAILQFSYALLHDQVLIVDPRSKAIVSIVAN